MRGRGEGVKSESERGEELREGRGEELRGRKGRRG